MEMYRRGKKVRRVEKRKRKGEGKDGEERNMKDRRIKGNKDPCGEEGQNAKHSFILVSHIVTGLLLGFLHVSPELGHREISSGLVKSVFGSWNEIPRPGSSLRITFP
jgi:hypothetical protein